ncbi:MAG TPA: hypothetical protein VE219_00305 [Candidatus Sulfotelmatobacter sp.]|nr:hypothetical protein [Candidatus Sulfotelmatobacter sp.]
MIKPAWHQLLETEAQFQAAWYFSLLLLLVVIVVGTAATFALRTTRRMWRAGDQPLALVVSGVCGVAILFFLSMALTALLGFITQG